MDSFGTTRCIGHVPLFDEVSQVLLDVRAITHLMHINSYRNALRRLLQMLVDPNYTCVAKIRKDLLPNKPTMTDAHARMKEMSRPYSNSASVRRRAALIRTYERRKLETASDWALA